MNFPKIPSRIFLDTSVVNFILDYGEQIHDGVEYPHNLSERAMRDIDALYNIFLTGQRATWQLAISPKTYKEVTSTQDAHRHYQLENWFYEIWNYWLETLRQSNDTPLLNEADSSSKFLSSGVLDVLPDLNDRILICDALTYHCDIFCTRDWRTILKHRDSLSALPIRILTPTEWWLFIQPLARLWA